VAHERGEPVEPRLWVEPLSVPPQQAPHRERVTEGVETRWRGAGGDRDGQFGDKTMEGLAGSTRVDAGSTVEAEQRDVAGPVAAIDMVGEQLSDTRPVGDEATLAELSTSHDEQLPVGVDIAEAKATCLPGPQTEAITEGEDSVVSRATASRTWIVGQGCGSVEQLTGLGDVEEERQALICLPSMSPAQRRRFEALLGDGPVEEAAEDPDELIEAAGSGPRPRCDELIEQGGR
jgi:hypothetical protein